MSSTCPVQVQFPVGSIQTVSHPPVLQYILDAGDSVMLEAKGNGKWMMDDAPCRDHTLEIHITSGHRSFVACLDLQRNAAL